MQARASKSPGRAAQGPLCSVPAIGWVATYRLRQGWYLSRSAIWDLVEQTSMTILSPYPLSLNVSSTVWMMPAAALTGTDTTTTSLSSMHSSKETTRSTRPSRQAASAFSGFLSVPTKREA